MSDDELKKYLKEQFYIYECEKDETDIYGLHVKYTTEYNIEKAKKILKRRGVSF